MSDAKMLQAQDQANAAAQLGAGLQQQTGGQWHVTKPVKRDEYANRITVERREHDAVLLFQLAGKDYCHVVREITVPLSALEELT